MSGHENGGSGRIQPVVPAPAPAPEGPRNRERERERERDIRPLDTKSGHYQNGAPREKPVIGYLSRVEIEIVRSIASRRWDVPPWREMKRQHPYIEELRCLFEQAPEALDW